MYLKNMYQLLSEAHMQRRSLELYYRVRVNQQTADGAIYVYQGNVLRLQLGQHTNQVALRYLLQTEPILVVGLPLSEQVKQPDPEAPQAAEILKVLAAMIQSQTNLETANSPKQSVYEQVEVIFQDVLGKGASSQLLALAKQYPPASQPKEFVQAAHQIIALLVGDAAAKKMLGSIQT